MLDDRLQVDVLKPVDAKYVESQIPGRDLLVFVAEYTEDLNAFLAVVRDTRNLRINAAVAPPDSLDSFQVRVDWIWLRGLTCPSYTWGSLVCAEVSKHTGVLISRLHLKAATPAGNRTHDLGLGSTMP